MNSILGLLDDRKTMIFDLDGTILAAHGMLARPLPFVPGAERLWDLVIGAQKRVAIATSTSPRNAA